MLQQLFRSVLGCVSVLLAAPFAYGEMPFNIIPATHPEKFSPLTHKADDTWHESNYWVSDGWLHVGKDWQHPEQNADAVRTFPLLPTAKLPLRVP